MGAVTSESTAWPDGIIQLLDEHHLVVVSDNFTFRDQFAVTLKHHLDAMAETQVITIDGRHATDLREFYTQVRKQLPLRPPSVTIQPMTFDGAPEMWWHDIESVIGLLRSADSSAKHRYFIWQEADALLKADPEIFSRLVNALLGVAAEQEYISPDTLVLQRSVFLGGSALSAYAENRDGQFQRWLTDDDATPFWEVVSVLDRPPVLTYRLG